jgi:transcription antitermination factor NusG
MENQMDELTITMKIWAIMRREPGERGFPGSNANDIGIRKQAIRELHREEAEFMEMCEIERRGY